MQHYYISRFVDILPVGHWCNCVILLILVLMFTLFVEYPP